MYTKQFNRQQRRVQRRLNKTGIQLVMDVNKRKTRWRSVYNISVLSKEEKNALQDIMHNETLRHKYIN